MPLPCGSALRFLAAGHAPPHSTLEHFKALGMLRFSMISTSSPAYLAARCSPAHGLRHDRKALTSTGF